MRKFRKKPVEVEATQWFKNGDHPLDYAADEIGFENGAMRVFTGAERKANGWEGGVVRYFRRPDVSGERPCEKCGVRMHEHGWIDTPEGGHIVCPGDWIITGVMGEMYPCKPDIFAATYEPVNALPYPPGMGEESRRLHRLYKAARAAQRAGTDNGAEITRLTDEAAAKGIVLVPGGENL